MIENFSIKELVCPHVYKQFSQAQCWGFLDPRLIETIDVLRNGIFKCAIVVNNSRNFTQRGLRCNMCTIVKEKKRPYMSGHVLGRAIDFNVKGMTAKEAIEKIEENKLMLPYPIRIEIDDVERVHIDVMTNNQTEIITYF